MTEEQQHRKEIGERLKMVRDHAGEKQSEMAKRLRVANQSVICKYERGDTPISPAVWNRIIREYGVESDWLYDGVGNPPWKPGEAPVDAFKHIKQPEPPKPQKKAKKGKREVPAPTAIIRETIPCTEYRMTVEVEGISREVVAEYRGGKLHRVTLDGVPSVLSRDDWRVAGTIAAKLNEFDAVESAA